PSPQKPVVDKNQRHSPVQPQTKLNSAAAAGHAPAFIRTSQLSIDVLIALDLAFVRRLARGTRRYSGRAVWHAGATGQRKNDHDADCLDHVRSFERHRRSAHERDAIWECTTTQAQQPISLHSPAGKPY